MGCDARFELHGLEKLCATFSVGGQKQDVSIIRNTNELISEEISKIGRRLRDNVLALKGKGAICRYVRLHQYALIRIMNDVFTHKESPGATDCHKALHALFEFIREQFPAYFDDLARAPLKEVQETRELVLQCLPQLETTLLSASVNSMLVDIMVYPLKHFVLEGSVKRVSINRLTFLRCLLGNLKQLDFQKPDRNKNDLTLLHLLVYLNCNSRNTFLGLAEYVFHRNGIDRTGLSKPEYMRYLVTVLRCTTVKPGMAYHPNAPTLKRQLISYVTAELSRIVTKGPPAEPLLEPQAFSIPTKIRFDVSVAQFACILKMLLAENLIVNTNVAQIFRAVASSCETKRAGNLSVKSLKERYYKVEPATMEMVRHLLTRLSERMELLVDETE